MSKTIIITGATGKLGKILVKNFLKGDSVIAIARSKEKLNLLKSYKSTTKQNLFLFCIDLVKNGAITKVIKMIKKAKLKPDAIINNARNLDYLKLSNNGKTSSINFLNEFNLGVVIPYQLIMSLVENFPKSLKV